LSTQPITSEVGVKDSKGTEFTLKYYDLNFNVKEVKLDSFGKNSRVDAINDFLRDEYNKELKALEQKPTEAVTPATPVTAPVTTDARVAEIERKRQEEFEKSSLSINGKFPINIKDAFDRFTGRVKLKPLESDGTVVLKLTYVTSLEGVKKLAEEYKRINAEYDAELAALEGAKPEVDLSNLSENLPNVNESNAQNAADILSSLGIDVTGQLGLNFPNANDTDTDITNKKCKE
jgi:hypothetical protein